ncbi:MAG TPA: GntR family transcriptional regulator [Thermodesulfobacteriota bacterium]
MRQPLARLEIAVPRPLREEVYVRLRQAILDSVYPAGTKLVEADLAAALCISRTPIREALHKLELEGLVERVPGGTGLRVAGLSREEVEEIYGIRATLEGYAARLAAARMTGAEAARLSALLDASAEAVAAGDTEALLRINTEFHGAIYRIAGSRRLEGLVRGLHERVMRYRAATLEIDGQGRVGLDEHRAILGALAAGDAARAEALAVAHVRRKMRVVAEHLSTETASR